MASISDGSTNPDAAAVLAFVRLLQHRLNTALVDGSEIDGLLKLLLALMETYLDEICPTLMRAFARARQASLPRVALDELTAAEAKIQQDLESANADLVGMIAAGVNKAQIPRRSISAIEHLIDEARTVIKRIDRLIEECESRSV